MTLSEPMNVFKHRVARMVLAAAVVAGGWSPAWAQDGDNEPESPREVPVAPAPPSAPKAPKAPSVENVTKQVRILRQEDGTLRIIARGDDGENADIQVDLGEQFGGAVTRRIYEKLEEKGILDEKGLIVEEAMEDALDSVPPNVELSIAADVERAERIRAAIDSEHRHASRHQPDHDLEEWLVPIVGILAVFGTPILIVWLVTRNSYRKKQLLMENINRLVADGRDIPQELLDALDESGPAKTKDRGFTLIAVGAAIFIFLTGSAGVGVGSLGLIPLFIGIARYINWKLDHQNVNTSA